MIHAGSIYKITTVNPTYGLFEDDYATADRYCCMRPMSGMPTAIGQYYHTGGVLYAWCSDGADPDTHTMRSITASTIGFMISGESYITVDGLVVKYWKNLAELSRSGDTNNIITNCTMTHSGWTGVHLEGSYCQFTDNTLTGGSSWMAHSGEGINMNEPAGDGNYNLIEGNTITFGAHTNITLKGEPADENSCKYNIIRDNTLGRCGGSVMQIRKGKYCLVEENIITDAVSSDEVGGSGQSGHTGIYITEGHNIIVRRNQIFENGGGAGAGMSASGSSNAYYYYYHNTLHDNYRGLETGGAITKYVYNKNNIYHDSQSKSLYLDIASDALANDMYWNNNVFVGPDNHVYGYGGSVTLAWLEANKATYFYDNETDEPLFIDETNDDYTIPSHSPCVGTADWLTLTNGTGNASTTLIVDDAGWFFDGEGIITGDTIQLQGQATTAIITSINYGTNTLTIDTALTWADGIGVALDYEGSVPDIGYYEYVPLGGGSDQVDWPNIYLDESVAGGGVGSQADPYSDFSEINWTTGDDNSVFDYYDGTPDKSVTINLNMGETWSEILTVGESGTATYPLIIQTYGTGADPIISGGDARNYGITATSKDYITVDGLDIRDVLLIGIDVTTSDNWIVQNCNVQDYGDGDVNAVGISFHGATGSADNCDSILIDSNTIGTAECSTDGSVERAGIRLHGIDNSTISNNTVTTGQTTTGTQGILIYLSRASVLSTDNIIEYNDVTGCEIVGIQTRDSDGTIIRYNKIHDHLGGGIGCSYNSTGTYVYYNLIYDIQGASTQGNHFNGIDINQTSVNGFYYNNVIYDVDNCGITIETSADGNTIKNNIIDASGNSNSQPHCIYIDASISTFTLGNNLYYDSGDSDIGLWHGLGAGDHKTFAEWIALTSETGSLNSASQMIDPANGDLTLNPHSPCIFAGTTVGLIIDYLGFGIRHAPCIGAYENQINAIF